MVKEYFNEYQQPVGFPLEDWTVRKCPDRVTLAGRYCRLEPVKVERDAKALYAAYRTARDDSDWTYLFYGPFEQETSFREHMQKMESSDDPHYFTVIETRSDRPVGTLSLMRINPEHGVIEVGHVAYSPLLKKTVMATEAHFLLMKYVFDELKYRRYEWKCDSRNAPSRRAAERLGFTFEGIFRQDIVYKNRSRDTAWFSIIDGEWPRVGSALQQWLEPANFDPTGRQRRQLQEIRRNIRPDSEGASHL